jgi:hypothetical protein
MANGQVGLLNRIDSRIETLSAGRDVNQLPKEAVDVMLGAYRMTIWLILSSLTIAIVAIAWIGRNARLREKLRADEEHDERKILSDLLMETLAMLPESRSKEIRELKDKLANRTRIDIPVESKNG